MQRLDPLTGGGDAPGLNAVTRAMVKTAGNEFGCGLAGIEDGYDGLLMPDRAYMLTPEAVRGLVARGGTSLDTANRGNPFARRVIRAGQEVVEDISDQLQQAFQQLRLDGLIVVGGDGTLRIADELVRASACPSWPCPRPSTMIFDRFSVNFAVFAAIATDGIDVAQREVVLQPTRYVGR
jgi:6-phosphofructokinase